MAKAIYGLTETDVERLRAMLLDFERGPKRYAPWQTQQPSIRAYPDTEFGRADALIAGSTTTTPGKGVVSIWDFTSTGGTTDTTINVTAYNMTDRDVTTAYYCQLQLHPRSGRWMIVNGANTALLYYGQLSGALASSAAATCTVDTLSPMDATVGTTASSLTVQNRLGWTGLDNGKCYVARNMDLGTWDLIQLECS